MFQSMENSTYISAVKLRKFAFNGDELNSPLMEVIWIFLDLERIEVMRRGEAREETPRKGMEREGGE